MYLNQPRLFEFRLCSNRISEFVSDISRASFQRPKLDNVEISQIVPMRFWLPRPNS